ncbi:MAG TPA: hypothetical protein VFT16_00695 [Candidatus Saccharimonadales bacterium]|nr:hypothetical protein [Candidatus Saccharimonadales bacterium]
MIRDEQQLQERIDGFLGRKQAQYPEITISIRTGRLSPKTRRPQAKQSYVQAIPTR